MSALNPRVSDLIKLLDLKPHPEGGHFHEVFRSSTIVRRSGGREQRSALTTIYFLLTAGGHSRWHKVGSDEVWQYHEGDPLELFWVAQGAAACSRAMVGEAGGSNRPIAVVPGGSWQTARTTGEYTLVGCTVGPGFEYADFRLLRDLPEEAEEMRRRFAELAQQV